MSRRMSYGYEPWTITVASDGDGWLATRIQPGIPHRCAHGVSRSAALKALVEYLTRHIALDPSDPLSALCRWPASWPRETSLRDEIVHHAQETS